MYGKRNEYENDNNEGELELELKYSLLIGIIVISNARRYFPLGTFNDICNLFASTIPSR